MAPFFKKGKKKPEGDPVVVVSGLPRSGTSMAMKMLEAGGFPLIMDGIRTADDDNPKGYFEDERVKDLHKMEDKSWVSNARGKAIKVISFLLKELPEENHYKVIFMRRHLDEVLASQNKMLENRGEESETPDERMKELYEDHLKKVFEMMEQRENFDVLYVGYTETVQNPADTAKKIREFVGPSLDVEKMTAVADKSLYRNRAEGK